MSEDIESPYAELKRRVTKLYEDMYEGDGKENPSMTTRMDAVERATLTISGNLTWVVRLMIGLLITGIIDVVKHFIH